MLVLSRKRQESVVVGNPDNGQPLMRITVLGMRSGKVTLGFDIAADVPVHRAEVWERLHANVDGDAPVPNDHSVTARGTPGEGTVDGR